VAAAIHEQPLEGRDFRLYRFGHHLSFGRSPLHRQAAHFAFLALPLSCLGGGLPLPLPFVLGCQPPGLLLGAQPGLLRPLGIPALLRRFFRLPRRDLSFLSRPRFARLLLEALALQLRLLMRGIHLG
jgi:hypothetical protein